MLSFNHEESVEITPLHKNDLSDSEFGDG